MGNGRVQRIGRGSIVCRRSTRRGCQLLSRLGRCASGLWMRVGCVGREMGRAGKKGQGKGGRIGRRGREKNVRR
jgi:hypothetical protein